MIEYNALYAINALRGAAKYCAERSVNSANDYEQQATINYSFACGLASALLLGIRKDNGLESRPWTGAK